MKQYKWHITFGVTLIAISAAVYLAQDLIFHNSRDTFFYMLQDLAFLPVQVLLVTLILNDLMRRRERSLLQHKMNMVIGAFFSEIGNDLLAKIYQMDTKPEKIAGVVAGISDWTDEKYESSRKYLSTCSYMVNADAGTLEDMKVFMASQRSFILGLLENPNLIEHESFTELLWAICHLGEELSHRKDLQQIPESDVKHMGGDIQRAYKLLVLEWMSYVKHLKDQYPYMFSLVVRTNPFNPDASPEVYA